MFACLGLSAVLIASESSAQQAEPRGKTEKITIAYPSRGITVLPLRVAAKPPAALSLTKSLLYQMDGLDFSAALEAGVQGNAIARMTDDCKQGVRRFLEKR